MAREHTWPGILGSLIDGTDLSISEAEWAMQSVMAGEATSAQLGGLLVALRIKGESVDEIVGFRDAVLANALPLSVDSMANPESIRWFVEFAEDYLKSTASSSVAQKPE